MFLPGMKLIIFILFKYRCSKSYVERRL